MDDFFKLAGLLMIAVTAITQMVKTAITETQKTKRAMIESGSNPGSEMIDNPAKTNRYMTASSATPSRFSVTLGLVSVLVASSQLFVLQFGAVSAAPVSAGDAASIAQSLALLAIGLVALGR